MTTVTDLENAACTPTHIEQHIHVSRADKFIYVVNLKAASTSLRALLLQCAAINRGAAPLTTKYKSSMRTEFDGIDTIGGPKLVSHLNDPNWFTFTCVRHPYTRTLSTYYKKLHQDATRLRMKDLFEQHGLSFEWPLSFDAFLTFLEVYEAPPETLNRHWISQAKGTFHGTIKYDRILRFESLRSDLNEIAERICVNPDALKHLNQRKGVSSQRLELSQSHKQRIYNLYKEDFEAFGYEPDDFS